MMRLYLFWAKIRAQDFPIPEVAPVIRAIFDVSMSIKNYSPNPILVLTTGLG